jgi:DNA-binding response OmpR family regulator
MKHQPAPLPVARKRRILLVEDHQDSAEFLARLLANDGHDVRVAATASAARQLAEQGFDLLLTDITLPDGSGRDILHDLSRGRDVPAIAFSGFCSDEDVARSRDAGFVAHFVKPIDFRQLRAAIEDAFAAEAGGT